MSLFGLSPPVTHDEKHTDKKRKKDMSLDKIQKETILQISSVQYLPP